MPKLIPQFEREPAVDSLIGNADRQLPSPLPKEQWFGRLRYIVVPILAVLAIATAIYVLEDEPDVPQGGADAVQGTGAEATGSARPVRVTASAEELARTPAPRIGYAAPDFTLAGLDGKPSRLSDFRGSAVP